MGIFLSLTATDLAVQIQKDGLEAVSRINALASQYDMARPRIIQLLKMPNADDLDKAGIIATLQGQILLMQNLINKVSIDVGKIQDGSIVNTDPYGTPIYDLPPVPSSNTQPSSNTVTIEPVANTP